MKKGLFIKKSIGSLLKETTTHKHGLKRTLGSWSLMGMGVGATIGAGLFVLTGTTAAKFSGPGVIISFLIATLIASFAALCYAEFASLIPIAGSAYTYAYVTMGEFFAWVMGVALTLEYFFSFCTVAVAWSGYFKGLLKDIGLVIPDILSQSPFLYDGMRGWIVTDTLINLPAMIIIVLIGWLNCRGIQIASLLNDLFVILKLGVIILFVGFGIAFIKGTNLVPFIPENIGSFGDYGWSGVIRGAGVVFFAFLGFDAVSTLAQEAKNPKRDMPIGMLGSLLICALTYMVFGFVMTGVVNYRELDVADPVGVAVNAFGPRFFWLRYIVNLAILAGLSSVILVMMSGLARIFYTISHDGLLPKIFGKTHPKYRTPFQTTIIISSMALLLVGFFPVDILGQLTSMGALFVFSMVCFGILILRFSQPTLHRPFKTPFTPWVPLLGTLSCIIQMAFMPKVTWIQFLTLMGLGCSFYFLYSKKKSILRNPLSKVSRQSKL